MSTQSNPTPGWEGDASGLLTGYSQRLQRRRLLIVTATTAGTAGATAILGAIGWNAYLQRLGTEYQHFGLTCSDVRELLPDYKANRLDAQRAALLEQHVRRCSNCIQFLGELRDHVS
jgi:hypothetical protein